ncbi:DUF1674 domain-containing protein [Lichenibacterium minor]
MVQAGIGVEGEDGAATDPNTNGIDGLPTNSLRRMAGRRKATYMKGERSDAPGSSRVPDKGGGSVIDDEHRTNSAEPASVPQAGAAERALEEAEQRRAARKRADQARPREINGRQGPEPVRYGDWENKGIACDF